MRFMAQSHTIFTQRPKDQVALTNTSSTMPAPGSKAYGAKINSDQEKDRKFRGFRQKAAKATLFDLAA